jgi:hypothetical protein
VDLNRPLGDGERLRDLAIGGPFGCHLGDAALARASRMRRRSARRGRRGCPTDRLPRRLPTLPSVLGHNCWVQPRAVRRKGADDDAGAASRLKRVTGLI